MLFVFVVHTTTFCLLLNPLYEMYNPAVEIKIVPLIFGLVTLTVMTKLLCRNLIFNK